MEIKTVCFNLLFYENTNVQLKYKKGNFYAVTNDVKILIFLQFLKSP